MVRNATGLTLHEVTSRLTRESTLPLNGNGWLGLSIVLVNVTTVSPSLVRILRCNVCPLLLDARRDTLGTVNGPRQPFPLGEMIRLLGTVRVTVPYLFRWLDRMTTPCLNLTLCMVTAPV